MKDLNLPQKELMFGHPTGLFTLFFAELWERFSYYGMRALLVFYMIKGFMSYNDGNAYTIYGAYTALVYMTPFFGGMIADRLLGARRAVILGGLLMSAGHLTMTVQNKTAFFSALALLIVGNGFFKPNISTMVGTLYPQNSPKRDGGFTIFYIGINLGAAIAPLLCGYIGEQFGWHKGFGLATIGMLTGLAVFIAPTILSQILLLVGIVLATLNILELEQFAQFNDSLNLAVSLTLVLAGVIAFRSLGKREKSGDLSISPVSNLITQFLILLGAGGIAFAMVRFHPDEFWTSLVFYVVAAVLVIAALVSVLALSRSGLPGGAGLPPSIEGLQEKRFGITKEWLVYIGALISVPVFMLLVSGFEPIFGKEGGVQMIPDEVIKRFEFSDSALMQILGTVVAEMSRPAGLVLLVAGLGALIYLASQIFRLDKIARERMFVVMILTFFSMLFWSFFEQAGSSVNNFTDRNVDRVIGTQEAVTSAKTGETITLSILLDSVDPELQDLPELTQEFLGYENGDPAMTDRLARVVRLVERKKIENRDSTKDYDPAIDAAKEKIISEVWAEFKPPENGDGEEAEKTPEQRMEDWQAGLERDKELENRVMEAVKASPELDTDDELALQTLVTQLVKRIGAEKTVDAIREQPALTMTGLTYLREYVKEFEDLPLSEKTLDWTITEQNAGISLGGAEVPASVYQSVNPIFILIFGLIFTALWGWMGARGIEPSTPVKFSFGLIQLGMGFACFWMGAATASAEGMVGMTWLIFGYLFQTTGELCLSPVGLSMVTKLSPARLVSTVMGTWFLATAFSQFLAAIIAQFTGVSEGGGESIIPVPTGSIDVYGNVFRLIAYSAIASGLICLILSPILKIWMHEDVMTDKPDGDQAE
jgi:dipeptide/tripeptide permease